MFSDCFESVLNVLAWNDSLVGPDELLIVKKKAVASGSIVWVGNLKGIAHRPVGIAE